jgi:thiol:disulfide interchange protein DsbD
MPALGAAAPGGWVAFSPEAIESNRRDGKAVFVDFTATWCITCQVNKRVALDQPDVVNKMKAMDVVRMQADWTRKDPIITEALARFGRNGVPLYVLYPATGEPIVLPELLTPSIVTDYLEKLERR